MAHETTQHYSQEVELFARFLDPYMKYSSGLFLDRGESLDTGILRMLDQIPDHLLDEETLLGQLAVQFPHENPGRQFRTVIAWGRYAGLLAYNSARKTLRLAAAAEEPSPSTSA